MFPFGIHRPWLVDLVMSILQQVLPTRPNSAHRLERWAVIYSELLLAVDLTAYSFLQFASIEYLEGHAKIEAAFLQARQRKLCS